MRPLHLSSALVLVASMVPSRGHAIHERPPEKVLASAGYTLTPASLELALATDRGALRLAAARVIAVRKIPCCREGLDRALVDDWVLLRIDAARALSKLGHRDRAVASLRRELSPRTLWGSEAAVALAEMGNTDGIPSVIDRLRGGHEDRTRGATYLARLWGLLPRETIAVAAPYIADPHPRVRLGVARLLLLSRDPAAMGLVLTRLFDEDPAVRSLARHPERPSEL